MINIDDMAIELEKVGDWRLTQCYQKCPSGNYCAEITISKSFVRKVIHKYGDTPTEAMLVLLTAVKESEYEIPSSNR